MHRCKCSHERVQTNWSSEWVSPPQTLWEHDVYSFPSMHACPDMRGKVMVKGGAIECFVYATALMALCVSTGHML